MGLLAVIVAVVIIVAIIVFAVVSALSKSNDAGESGTESDPQHNHAPGETSDNCAACKAAASPIKKKIPMKCMVQFRPLDSWKGEYGFDWLRIGNDKGEKAGEDVYKDTVDGGVKLTNIVAGKIEVTQEYTHSIVPPETVTTEDYAAVKKEYKTISTEIKSDPQDLKEYFVPYLNLFPQSFLDTLPVQPGVPPPLSEAELKVLITVERESDEPEKIELDYAEIAQNLLELKYDFTDKTKKSGIKRKSDNTVKIKCLKDLTSDIEVKVMAYPKGAKGKSDAQEIGKLIVCKNDAAERRELKFVLVKVKTDVLNTGIPTPTNGYGATETNNFHNTLHQALFIGSTENSPLDLDLTADPDFKIITDAAGTKVGKYIDPVSNKIKSREPGFKPRVKALFVNDPNNSKYQAGYFTVFSFSEPALFGVMGSIEGIGIRSLVMFNNRDNTTFNHEVMHGLHLRHTHREKDNAGNFVKIESPDAKHTFTKPKTDNVMSYNSEGLTTWHWQWQILKSKNP